MWVCQWICCLNYKHDEWNKALSTSWSNIQFLLICKHLQGTLKEESSSLYSSLRQRQPFNWWFVVLAACTSTLAGYILALFSFFGTCLSKKGMFIIYPWIWKHFKVHEAKWTAYFSTTISRKKKLDCLLKFKLVSS